MIPGKCGVSVPINIGEWDANFKNNLNHRRPSAVDGLKEPLGYPLEERSMDIEEGTKNTKRVSDEA